MALKPLPNPSPQRRQRGFEAAGGLVQAPVRAVGEARGFAVARLLTHWAEAVGEDLAARTRPVKIGYGKGGMGATLTLLVKAAEAPMIQMALPHLKDRVNAVYGYAAVSHIHLTQTAATGFAEGQADFAPAPVSGSVPTPSRTPNAAPKPGPDPATRAQAQAAAEGVGDPALRAALELMAQNILTRPRS